MSQYENLFVIAIISVLLVYDGRPSVGLGSFIGSTTNPYCRDGSCRILRRSGGVNYLFIDGHKVSPFNKEGEGMEISINHGNRES